MSLKQFILSKVFLKHLAIAITVAIVALMLLMIWLNFYTRHGQARPVPDFKGLTMEETAKLARKHKLRYEIIDSIYTSLVPPGCIAEQNPRPGFKVKKRRNIVLTINAFNPEMVTVPNLIDLPIRQAQKLIESSGLVMGDPTYKPDLSINVVLEQRHGGRPVNAGDVVQKGSVIELVLGKGLSNQRTAVPYLTGLNLEPARDKILMSALSLGTYVFDNTISTRADSMNAFVYKQIPDYRDGATIQLGSAMYLWLTVDSAKLSVDSSMVATDTIPASEITFR